MESLKLFGFFYEVYDSEDVKRVGNIDVVATNSIQAIGCGYEVLFDLFGHDVRANFVQIIPCTKIGSLRFRSVFVAPNDYTKEEIDALISERQLLINDHEDGCVIITLREGGRK